MTNITDSNANNIAAGLMANQPRMAPISILQITIRTLYCRKVSNFQAVLYRLFVPFVQVWFINDPSHMLLHKLPQIHQ